MTKFKQHINKKKKIREKKRAKKLKNARPTSTAVDTKEKQLLKGLNKTLGKNVFNKQDASLTDNQKNTSENLSKSNEKVVEKFKTSIEKNVAQVEELNAEKNVKKSKNNRWKKLKAELKAKKKLRQLQNQQKAEVKSTENKFDSTDDESLADEDQEVSLRDELLNNDEGDDCETSEVSALPPSANNKALQKLRVAQFRIINETLYTSNSEEAEGLFKRDRNAFQIYHEGYRSQVTKWPVNPLDRIIAEIKKQSRGTVVADLGCGEAKLAKTLKPLGFIVHSFDLVAANEYVVACNIKNVPLKNESVQIVVMCLSLMGTDMGQFVLEANRILKANGTLKVAEVESRIPSIDLFIKVMKRYGFSLERKDTAHSIFHYFDFRKAKSMPKGAEKNMDRKLFLKPCLYKKR